ncbi:MAG: hypothetical protein IJS81_09800 [Selenomonadaceae bacterium]|nr:hypothetical protein [Selenomonadaceae bacterium]
MARKATVRSITLSDEIFNGLKMAAAVQGTTVSKIVETLAAQYLQDNSASMKEQLKKQLDLFDYLGNRADQK